MVNVQADDQLEQLHFDTRRAWNIKVTQIPCGCSDIGQAHHMFSRFLNLQIYEFFHEIFFDLFYKGKVGD